MHRSPLSLAALVVLAFSVPHAALAETKVVDGGTVLVDGATVKLWGIEAPVPGRMCETAAGSAWPCGDRARDQLAAVAGEDEIVCEPKDDGTAICRAGGLDLGALMVKEGLAWSRGGYDDIQADAKAARIGVWE
jgi:endonuclease YncB( thermonuclease family)